MWRAVLRAVGICLLIAGPVACDTVPEAPGRSGPPVVVRIDGAAVMGADLVPDLAEAYLKGIGATDIHTEDRPNGVTVSGSPRGGSAPLRFDITSTSTGRGFLALADGRTDLVMASRPLAPAEREAGDVLGTGYLVGFDALVPVIHPRNRVPAVSLPALSDVLSCRIRDWKDAAGAPGRIEVYVTDSLAGDFDLDTQLAGTDLCPAARRLSTDRDVAAVVEDRPTAVGLISSAYAHTVTELPLGSDPGTAVVPSDENLRSELYPLTRRLVLYPSIGSGAAARQFGLFATGEGGGAIVDRLRFVHAATPVPDPDRCKSPADYCAFVRGTDRIPGDIRFAFGSSGPASSAATAVLPVCADQRRRGATDRSVILAGFADDIGSDRANRILSEERAAAIARLFGDQGVTARHQGFGETQPVDTNQTRAGRGRNRRVEVWLIP